MVMVWGVVMVVHICTEVGSVAVVVVTGSHGHALGTPTQPMNIGLNFPFIVTVEW